MVRRFTVECADHPGAGNMVRDEARYWYARRVCGHYLDDETIAGLLAPMPDTAPPGVPIMVT